MTANAEWAAALRALDLPAGAPIIAHASLSAFGLVEGGADTVVNALLDAFETVIMPAFTYATMVTPETGPAGNGIIYGTQLYPDFRTRFFDLNMPVDVLIGVVPERLRQHPKSRRSMHPILSFVGVKADEILALQSIAEPLAPIGGLLACGGWGLLLGVDHTVNTSVHWGERLGGRQGFIRWALTTEGVVACPRFPGCSDGFGALAPRLEPETRRVRLGQGEVLAFPLAVLMRVVAELLAADPEALLCDRTYCDRCETVRERVHLGWTG